MAMSEADSCMDFAGSLVAEYYTETFSDVLEKISVLMIDSEPIDESLILFDQVY